MVAWAMLVSLVVVMIGKTEAAEKAVISLEPPWTTIFKGHRVILTCSAPGEHQNYYWGKNFIGWHTGRTKEIKTAEKSDSGEYKCHGTNSEISDPITLTVSDDWAILQVPYYAVFEGDELRLRCRGWYGYTVTSVQFSKDSQTIKGATTETFTIEDAKTSDSGDYQCEVYFGYLHGTKTSNRKWIRVHELFTIPQLKTTPQREVVEGQKMMLECYTELNPQKASTELLYSFYKDGALMMERSSQPQFVIAAVEMANGGDYKCEVQRAYKTVQKQSSSVRLSVRRIPISGISMNVMPQSGEAIEGARLTFNCSVAHGTGTITFAWCTWGSSTCKNSTMVTAMWAEYTIETMTEKDAGSYYCTASNNESYAIKSGTVEIHVKLRVSKPLLTLDPESDGVVEGDTVIIKCSCHRGSAPITYRFYLQERHVKTVEGNETQPGIYTISSISLGEAGMYYCEANNGIQDGVQRSENVTLAVMVPVSGATLRMDRASAEVLVGDNLTLICTVALGSSPSFQWLHNEKEIDVASEMFQLLSPGNSLHIKSVQKEHGGSYVCQARNQLNLQRTFNSTSIVLSIKVIEANNVLLTVVATLGPLVVIAVTAILVFVYCKHKKKTDDRYFTAPVSNHQIAEQRATISPTDRAELYGNVSAAASSRNDTDVVYAVIDTKPKRRAPAVTVQENLDYYVTYSSVKIGRPDKATGRREFDKAEEHDNLYQNFQNK